VAGRNGKVDVAQLVKEAREQLTQLTGRQAEGVLGVEHDDEGDTYTVTVEVLELQRIPSSTDVLGCYVARMDKDGNLLEYARRGRYQRAQAEGVET
jgi:Gas vesicle synthesis protein GvpO